MTFLTTILCHSVCLSQQRRHSAMTSRGSASSVDSRRRITHCGRQKWSVEPKLSLLAWRINLNMLFKFQGSFISHQRSTSAKFWIFFCFQRAFFTTAWMKISLSFVFLSSGSLYLANLGFKSELYFSCTLDFCIVNFRQRSRFVCLVYSPRSNIFFGVLFSYCRTAEKRLNGY